MVVASQKQAQMWLHFSKLDADKTLCNVWSADYKTGQGNTSNLRETKVCKQNSQKGANVRTSTINWQEDEHKDDDDEETFSEAFSSGIKSDEYSFDGQTVVREMGV